MLVLVLAVVAVVEEYDAMVVVALENVPGWTEVSSGRYIAVSTGGSRSHHLNL